MLPRLARMRGLRQIAVSLVAVSSLACAADGGSPDAEVRGLRGEVGRLSGELVLANIELHRLREIVRYSGRYRIPADLAGLVWEVALAEDIDPALAFALVQVESRFDALAVSEAGAVGLVQIMRQTAALLQPGVTDEELFDPATNLRIGLRHLSHVLDAAAGDTTAALLKYNGCVHAPGCRSYADVVLAAAVEMQYEDGDTSAGIFGTKR